MKSHTRIPQRTDTRALLLRMVADAVETVLVVFNGEREPPIAIHARLPEAERFVVLFGSQGGMTEVLRQESDLLVEGLLHLRGRGSILPKELLRVPGGHGREALRPGLFECNFDASL